MRPLLPVLLLAACAAQPVTPVPDPEAYTTTDAPIPFAVRQLLPRGLPDADVRVVQNCYGYVLNGDIFPVLIPSGTQYCI